MMPHLTRSPGLQQYLATALRLQMTCLLCQVAAEEAHKPLLLLCDECAPAP